MQMYNPFTGEPQGMNQNMIDALSVVSFLIGIANYNENLSQSDKDDLMAKLDDQTNSILGRLENEVKKQNEMLEYIIELLEGVRNESDNKL